MPPLHLKQEFPSLKAFKDALYVWAIEEHFEPRILKSDSHHVRVGCKFDPKCEFSIRCNAYNASPRTPNPYAKITVLRHEHNCTPHDPTNPLNRQVANRIPWLVENVPRFLDVTPTTTIESIQEAILTHSGYTVNLQQIRRVRRLLVKGKDFRSPQRDHTGQGGGHNSHPHPHPHPHNAHSQHGQQSVNSNGHPHASSQSQHTSNTPSSFTQQQQSQQRQQPSPPSHHPNTSPSHLLSQDQVPHPHPEDFSSASARLANQFEDHSQLIGALTDPSQTGVQVQSANMFDVNNPPPPRIIEAPVMSNGPGVGVGGTGSVAARHAQEAAMRCPFCVNVRWMKSIKDAVEHMTMHVV